MHLQYGCAFVEVDFNSQLYDNKAEELASSYPKNVFFRVEKLVVFEEFPEDFFQVCQLKMSTFATGSCHLA